MDLNLPPNLTEEEKNLYYQFLVHSMPNSQPVSLELYKKMNAVYEKVLKYQNSIKKGAERLKNIDLVNNAKIINNRNYLKNFRSNHKTKY